MLLYSSLLSTCRIKRKSRKLSSVFQGVVEQRKLVSYGRILIIFLSHE